MFRDLDSNRMTWFNARTEFRGLADVNCGHLNVVAGLGSGRWHGMRLKRFHVARVPGYSVAALVDCFRDSDTDRINSSFSCLQMRCVTLLGN